MATTMQPTLLAFERPSFDASCGIARRNLAAGAWYGFVPGFLRGDLALMDDLDHTTWHLGRRRMYDRMVDVPRQTAVLPRDGAVPPVLGAISAWLSSRFDEPFDRISLARYRDERDSVAPHGDQVARDLDTTVMATVSLGEHRRFVLSPVGHGPTVSLELGGGDLLVLGGTVQRTYRHGVPKATRLHGPRICVMFRPPWLG